jgi:hypothetical protein
MANMSVEQVAELVLGIARSQLAVIDSVASFKAGFKATHVRSILESASRIRSNHPETLADFPSRVLLQMLGRNPPDRERLARELEQLVTTRPAGSDQAVAPDPDSLDMTGS